MAIMCSKNPDPDDLCDDHPPQDLFGLRTAAKRLIDAIAAEPMPERLRDLATELGKALERQENKGMPEDPPAPE